MILELGDRVPCRAPCVEPASLSACVSAPLSVSVSLMNKKIKSLKNKERERTYKFSKVNVLMKEREGSVTSLKQEN